MGSCSSVKKIVFITTHNWDTKRLGGFHKFAAAFAEAGVETVFFSFPRPYYGLFMKREQLNAGVIRLLSKGKIYETASGAKILNVAFPTLRLPDAAGRIFPDFVMNWLLKKSFRSFKKFAGKYLQESECFVFESCEGIFLADKIKKLFPDAKIVYRPSDPLVYASVPNRVKKMEEKILLSADMNLIVNNEGVDSYKKNMDEFDKKVKYQILPNGIDLEPYKKKYPVPPALAANKTVLYVGAWDIEWPLIFETARRMPECNFVVVCPNYPKDKILKKMELFANVKYIPGIKPEEVPAWITNCSVVMVPYVTDFYKDRPLGITAKYYQAMAAQKPIVAYCDTKKLAEVGISVSYNYEDFISSLQNALCQKECSYNFDLEGRDWKKITDKMIHIVDSL